MRKLLNKIQPTDTKTWKYPEKVGAWYNACINQIEVRFRENFSKRLRISKAQYNPEQIAIIEKKRYEKWLSQIFKGLITEKYLLMSNEQIKSLDDDFEKLIKAIPPIAATLGNSLKIITGSEQKKSEALSNDIGLKMTT